MSRRTETARHFPRGGNTDGVSARAEAPQINNVRRAGPALVQAHRYPAEGFKLQVGEVVGQLHGLQVVEQKRHLPLFAAVGLDLLAGLPRPVPFVSATKANDEKQTEVREQEFMALTLHGQILQP